jgi:hypothetical protein
MTHEKFNAFCRSLPAVTNSCPMRVDGSATAVSLATIASSVAFG